MGAKIDLAYNVLAFTKPSPVASDCFVPLVPPYPLQFFKTSKFFLPQCPAHDVLSARNTLFLFCGRLLFFPI